MRQGPQIGFVAETGTLTTIAALLGIVLSLLSYLLHVAQFTSLFTFPPRRPYICIFLSFALLRPCSSYLFFLSTCYFLPVSSISDIFASRVLCFI